MIKKILELWGKILELRRILALSYAKKSILKSGKKPGLGSLAKNIRVMLFFC